MAPDTEPRPTRHDRPTSPTSARSDEPHTSPHELRALVIHAAASRKGLLFRIRAALDALRSFLAGRMISTIVVVAILMSLLFFLLDALF